MELTRKEYSWTSNGIGFLRLMLAALVILAHAPGRGGFDGLGFSLLGPRFGYGAIAVMGFFTLSGVLITRSWESSKGAKDYFVKRCLRILPGYWVCLIVCAFVLGPIAWSLAGTTGAYPWTGPDSAVGYVTHNITTKMNQDFIKGLYLMDGKEQGVNFPLWTIISEFTCYVLTGVAGMVGLSKKHRAGFLVALVGLTALLLFKDYRAGFPIGEASRLNHLLSYLIGICAYYYHEKIPLNPLLGWVSIALAVGSTHVTWLNWLFPFFFGYSVIVLGFLGPVKDIERKADFSYGVYMYGWPMQIMLPLVGGTRWGVWPYIGLTVLCVLPLAALSWYLVERPALKLKKLFAR